MKNNLCAKIDQTFVTLKLILTFNIVLLKNIQETLNSTSHLQPVNNT